MNSLITFGKVTITCVCNLKILRGFHDWELGVNDFIDLVYSRQISKGIEDCLF